MRFYSMNKRSLICINQSKSCKIHKTTIKKILRLFSPFHFQDLYTGDDFFTFWFPTNHNKMVRIKTETVMASSGSIERRQRERYFSYAICCWGTCPQHCSATFLKKCILLFSLSTFQYYYTLMNTFHHLISSFSLRDTQFWKIEIYWIDCNTKNEQHLLLCMIDDGLQQLNQGSDSELKVY